MRKKSFNEVYEQAKRIEEMERYRAKQPSLIRESVFRITTEAIRKYGANMYKALGMPRGNTYKEYEMWRVMLNNWYNDRKFPRLIYAGY